MTPYCRCFDQKRDCRRRSIPHVIPLLAWDPVAEDAVRALRKVAEERVGELVDALLDPKPAVRRHADGWRASSRCASRSGQSTACCSDSRTCASRCDSSAGGRWPPSSRRTQESGSTRSAIFDVVRREVAVGRPVWESHRLLDTVEADSRSFVDEFLKDRAGQSLAHAFTLLSLVLPTAPLQIAYRGLHTNDPGLRGTALEYLEGVLPPDIRDRLWPFLSDRPRNPRDSRARDEILADLLRSNESIMLNLEELRRRTGTGYPNLETPATNFQGPTSNSQFPRF